MTSLTQDIQDKLKRLTAFEKIILVNILIYFIGWVIGSFSRVTQNNSLNWLALPSDFSDFMVKPWTIVTYGFTHVEFWHLFFNMLVLYFVGRSFSNLFSIKLSLNVYFLGIIAGGLTYMLAYAMITNEIFSTSSDLVGASAGVRAALIFLCAYMPNYEVRIVKFRVKLLYFGLIMVAIDVIGVFGGVNQGGNIAHLGGDLLGFFYATQLLKGRDIGKWFEKIMDSVSSLFLFKSGSKLKTVHKRSKKSKAFAGHTKDEFGEFNKQKQIDIILDKISKSGYESLSKEEKEFLFRAGK